MRRAWKEGCVSLVYTCTGDFVLSVSLYVETPHSPAVSMPTSFAPTSRFRHPVLLRSQGVTDGEVSQQCSLDPMLVQVPLRQRGVFTSGYRAGRTGDQKTSR